MLKLIATFGALTAMAVPAAAEQVRTAGDASPTGKEDKIVCKIVKDIQWRTASHRVCFTAAKWRQISMETRKEYDDYRAYMRSSGVF